MSLRVELTIVLSGVFRWDERGVEILGKIRDGSGFPLGLPITSRTMKYFGETVS